MRLDLLERVGPFWVLETNRGRLILTNRELRAGPVSHSFARKAVEDLLFLPLPISRANWHAALRLLGGWA
jgi:hypothetical protein